MKLLQVKFFVFILLFFCVIANAQIQALFNNKTQLRNLTERWELDTTSVRGTFLVTPYKSMYVLPVHWTSSPNERPSSGNIDPDYIAPTGVDYDNVESKFQLSFKTKVLQSFFLGHGDLWVGYTQISHWQIYNNDLSRPFREVNYEPELILNFPIKFKFFGLNTRMVGLALNHESNGKSDPYSRSWNRVIFHAGFEYNHLTIYVRPWFILPAAKNDNPDIAEFIGRGDVNIIYTKNGNIVSFIGTHNLNLNSKSRGSAMFSWSYPIKNNLKGFLQLNHGYSETLIDYNHLQSTVGFGLSLIEWL